jgi:hypothetical protein
MQQVVRKLVFGLTWRISISDEARELAQLCGEARANAYTEAGWDQQHRYGMGRLKKPAGLRAAAAVLGYLLGEQGGVFVHQVGNGACCCVAVARHLPVEGMDRIGTRADMLACAADYLGRAEADGVRLYGDVATEELPGCSPLGLDRLVDSSGEIGRMQAYHRINPRWAAIAAAGVMSLLAWFGGDLMDAWQPPAVAAAAPSAQLRYRDRVNAAVAEVVKGGHFQADLMPAFTALADALPFAVNGWAFEHLSCEDMRCKAAWRRLPGGSAAAMLAALHVDGDDGSVSFPSVDTLQKELALPLTPHARKLLYAPNAMLDPAVLDWVQGLKDRGYEPKYSSPSPLVAPDPGLKPGRDALVLVGDYAITLPYRETADLSQLPDSMTIDHIEIRVIDHQIVATLRGKYYAL